MKPLSPSLSAEKQTNSFPKTTNIRQAAQAPVRSDLNILILSAAVGMGHMRAGEAIELAFGQLYPEIHVRHVDVLALATPAMRRCYGGGYLDCVNKAPAILRYVYNLMDKPKDANARTWWDTVRVSLEEIGLGRLLRLLHEKRWDLIINTHFLPGEIVADQLRKNRIAVPQVMVTTDFETHHFWITEPCDLYFTATEEGALYLQKQGIPPERTSVVGIPIHPAFSEPRERAHCRSRFGLGNDRPVIVQASGGFGVGGFIDCYRGLLQVEEPLQLVAVTGRNVELKKRLERIATPARHRAKILGYTTRMHELLRAADLLLSKPGGLTTSEALACGTPLAIVNPVPGQEERNSDLLLENGAAVKVNHLQTMPRKLTTLLRNPDRLETLRANAQLLGRPRAAFDIAQRSLALVRER